MLVIVIESTPFLIKMDNSIVILQCQGRQQYLKSKQLPLFIFERLHNNIARTSESKHLSNTSLFLFYSPETRYNPSLHYH